MPTAVPQLHWQWTDHTAASLAAALIDAAGAPHGLPKRTADALEKAIADGALMLDGTIYICERPYISATVRGGSGSISHPYLLEATLVLTGDDMLPLLQAWPEFLRATAARGLHVAGKSSRRVAELQAVRKGDWLIADGGWPGFEKGEPYAVHGDAGGLFLRDKTSRKVRFKGELVDGVFLIGFSLTPQVPY